MTASSFSLIAFSLRMFKRDARAGELRLLAAALVLAVAALSAVGFFTDRVSQALAQEANRLLGADLLLRADHPWPEARANEARSLGLRVAETRVFPSMAQLGEGGESRAQLAEIKAVSADYPLRGSLRVAPAANAADAPAAEAPPPGAVWLDERLMTALAAKVGDVLQLGSLRLRVAAVLTQEPDRGLNFFAVAPRLMMNLADLEATQLIQPGSRVTYRLLLAGEAKPLARFRADVEKSLGRGERIEDAENARPEIRSALERAQKFLGLAAMLTAVLAAVAVALAARRYMQRHFDPCAVMRCLGASQGLLLRVFLGQFLLLGLLSVALGCLLGYLAHFILHLWLAQLLASPLPLPGWRPAGQGALLGLVLLLGFSLPPILQLRRVSTLRVLRREFSDGLAPPARQLAAYAAGFTALAAMMLWLAGGWRLGLSIVGGFSGALLVFALLARLAVRLAARLRGTAGAGWRFGLANMERRAPASVAQIVALALGLIKIRPARRATRQKPQPDQPLPRPGDGLPRPVRKHGSAKKDWSPFPAPASKARSPRPGCARRQPRRRALSPSDCPVWRQGQKPGSAQRIRARNKPAFLRAGNGFFRARRTFAPPSPRTGGRSRRQTGDRRRTGSLRSNRPDVRRCVPARPAPASGCLPPVRSFRRRAGDDSRL